MLVGKGRGMSINEQIQLSIIVTHFPIISQNTVEHTGLRKNSARETVYINMRGFILEVNNEELGW